MPDGEDVGGERRENDRRMLKLEERFSDYAKWRNEVNIFNTKLDGRLQAQDDDLHQLSVKMDTFHAALFGENGKRIGLVLRIDRLERIMIGMGVVLMPVLTATVAALVALVFAMITGNISITRIP